MPMEDKSLPGDQKGNTKALQKLERAYGNTYLKIAQIDTKLLPGG